MAKKNGKRYAPEQIAKILQEVDAGKAIDDICREYGVSKGTYYNWKSRYGGMDVAEVQKMKQLEAENARLKRLVADLSLDNMLLKDLNSKKW